VACRQSRDNGTSRLEAVRKPFSTVCKINELQVDGFPQWGSRLVVGMAFLGAYLWGIQYVLRRYLLNDLRPSVYYGLTLRLILAASTAVVLYNAYAALASACLSDRHVSPTRVALAHRWLPLTAPEPTLCREPRLEWSKASITTTVFAWRSWESTRATI
jgi:hypothetical protein